MKYVPVIPFIVAMFVALSASGQEEKPVGPVIHTAMPAAERARRNEGSLRAIIARFFSSLQRRELDQAYSELTQNSRLAEKQAEIDALKQKTRQAMDLFGDVIGHELVETRWVGSHMARMTYLSLGKEYPLRWRFYFYEVEKTWRLIDIRVDDNLVRMFDEEAEPNDAE